MSSLQPLATSVLRTCVFWVFFLKKEKNNILIRFKILRCTSKQDSLKTRCCYIYLSQITDKELLTAQYFLLVTLCQVVKICKLVERRVGACEGRGSWQQQWVQRYELSYIQLTFPANI